MKKPQNTESLFYTIQGEGPAVVLIHGFLEDSSMWDNFTQVLAKNNTVICVDLPGHGVSPLNVGPELEQYAEAVFDVLDHENIERTLLVGHSMGGYVALAMADLSPSRITKLVLLNSTPLADPEERKQKRQQAIAVIRENPQLFVKTVVPSLFPPSERNRLKGVINELIVKASNMTADAIICATIAMKNRPDRSATFSSFKHSGLLIVGQHDNLVDSDALFALSKASENQFELYPAGHMMPFESIDKVRIFLTKFIL